MSEVTRILERVQRGEVRAAEELLPLVYEELRKLAAARLADEASGQTLQPTALVHEAIANKTGGEVISIGSSRFIVSPQQGLRCLPVRVARRQAQQLARVNVASMTKSALTVVGGGHCQEPFGFAVANHQFD